MIRCRSEEAAPVVGGRALYGWRRAHLPVSGRGVALAAEGAGRGDDHEKDDGDEGANLIAIHTRQDAFTDRREASGRWPLPSLSGGTASACDFWTMLPCATGRIILRGSVWPPHRPGGPC